MKNINKIAVMAALLIVFLSGCSQRGATDEKGSVLLHGAAGSIDISTAPGGVTGNLFSASDESNEEAKTELVQAENANPDEKQTAAMQATPAPVVDEQPVTDEVRATESAPITQDDTSQPVIVTEPSTEPQNASAPAPDPQPQPPARPAFDAGTVIGMACSQIGGMTRVNGAEQGMGSFTHSFSTGETQESIAAGLAAILAQERDLYGNTYYDIVYCGESGGYHTFRCYRA